MNRKVFQKVIYLFAGAFLFAHAILAAPAAHRYHTSLTRVDYNAEAKTVEITIQTYSHDLEAALEARTGARFNLEKTVAADKLVLAYLADFFVLKNKSGAIKKLSWIGFEQQSDGVFLYVEIEMPEGIGGATLENRFLFDQFNDQVNLVAARADGEKRDLVFKPGDKPQALTDGLQDKSTNR